MGRVLVVNHVSLDGVMQGPGRSDEDTRFGFTQGGWAADDDVAGRVMGERLAAGGGQAGWLLGRITYQGLLDHWTQQPDRSFGDALVAAPKYVATSTLEEPAPWPNTTLLRGDVVEAVGRVRADVEGTLTIMGSSRLIHALLPHDVIDEFVLFVNPCVVGSGLRLFPDGTPPRRMELTEATPTPSGIVVSRYLPTSRG